VEVVNDVTQIDEGTVAVEDAVPVDPVHILTPIVLASASTWRGCVALSIRVLNGVKCLMKTGAWWRATIGVRIWIAINLVRWRNDDDIVAMAHHETLTIARNRESVDAFTQLIEVTGGQVRQVLIAIWQSSRMVWCGSRWLIAAASWALPVPVLPAKHPVTSCGTTIDDCQIAIRTWRNWERHHPLLESVSSNVADNCLK
jgi:hypothetical protein